ncbi:hypothetical protein MKQ68_19845 [Chitinophaga horti]|uniref:Uncharacterized protein n=1 Tax=Chitinophaga horti TaxID=2920382 RepID=A0ABY6IYT4_9BACT|nr:hypothetical protein [Chitinophaga horti]UYQ92341.1 hypothetical protein MKQ68_19845 [Chitinophaga horti]
MVEVFKTNVHDEVQAAMLLGCIHARYAHYTANFDLEDCDRILRVKCASAHIPPQPLISLLQDHGFEASVLPDEIIAPAAVV